MIYNNKSEVFANNKFKYVRIEVFINGDINYTFFVGYKFKHSATLDDLKNFIKKIDCSSKSKKSIILRCDFIDARKHDSALKQQLNKIERIKALYKLQDYDI